MQVLTMKHGGIIVIVYMPLHGNAYYFLLGDR